MGVSVLISQSPVRKIMNRLFCIFIALCLISCNAAPQDSGQSRAERATSLFSIVKFANDDCPATTAPNNAQTGRFGTCYTAAECENRNGRAGASCAEGFGICCEFSLDGAAGRSASVASTNEKNTIIQETGTTASGMVTYQVCPCSADVCRIRFDFDELVLAEKVTGTSTATQLDADNQVPMANAIGNCLDDTFSITGVGASPGSPIICGTNTGHHMIMDSNGQGCHNINIMLGAGSTVNRRWTINVVQHTCSFGTSTLLAESTAGPPGCLQYHTTAAGRISDYGSAALPAAPTALPALAATQTHLANQNYKICIRRDANNIRICYTDDGGAFGLSNAIIAMDQAEVDAACDTDFLTIPAAQGMAQTGFTGSVNRLCGRVLANVQGVASVTVCSRLTPFEIGFTTDAGEALAGTATQINNEALGGAAANGGIVGIRLSYTQLAT